MSAFTVLSPQMKRGLMKSPHGDYYYDHYNNNHSYVSDSTSIHRNACKCGRFSAVSKLFVNHQNTVVKWKMCLVQCKKMQGSENLSVKLSKGKPVKVHEIHKESHDPKMCSATTTLQRYIISNKTESGRSWLKNNPCLPYYNSGNEKKEGPLHSTFPTKPAEVSSVENLFDFICSGPLLDKVGLKPDQIAESIDKWVIYGSQLCRLFQLNELFLSEAQKVRIFHYYIPVFVWCQNEIEDHRSKFEEGDEIPPLLIGFSAPQGCGKTTLVFALDFLFQLNGRKTATISIDDFYLTAEDQAKLRNNNPGNRLLEFRGNAGSHDLPFSVETLTDIIKLTDEGKKMKIPRYNKSAYSGKGDRADPSKWPEIEGPLTAVLFEGWMLGFKPVPKHIVTAVDPQLEVINKNMKNYYEAWDRFIKSWIVIKIQDPSCVYQWRLQAEIAMRNDGKPGMSDEEVLDFVSRYLPAYDAYLPTLYAEGPSGSDPNHLLVIEIDEQRNPILGN